MMPVSKGFEHWEKLGNRKRASKTTTRFESLAPDADDSDDSEFEHQELDDYLREHGIEAGGGGDAASASNPTRSTCSFVENRKPPSTSAAPQLQRSPSVSSITSSASKRSSEYSFSSDYKRQRSGVSVFGCRYGEVSHA